MKIISPPFNRLRLYAQAAACPAQKFCRLAIIVFGLLTFGWVNLVFFLNTSPQLERYLSTTYKIGANKNSNNFYYVDETVHTTPGEIKKLANGLIIGARKCGTRALLEFLNLHPDIGTVRQETHFFDHDQIYNRGVEWYMSQMPAVPATPEAITPLAILEKTPGYFVSTKAPDRVYDYNASIKLILILRNPITRLISDYTQVHYTKLAKGKRHDILERVVFDEHGNVRACYKPVRNSLYADHVTRWLSRFPLANLHIVDGDLFIKDPLVELRRVETFLGLGHKITHQHIYFNQTKGFYCYRHPKEGAKCLGETKGRRHVTISAQARDRLRLFFRPYNEKLFSLVGKSFDW